MNMEDLDKKFEELVSQVDKRFEELGKRLEDRFSYHPPTPPEHRSGRRFTGASGGMALILVGIVMLADHFQWLGRDVPLIPTVLVILGIYLIIDNR